MKKIIILCLLPALCLAKGNGKHKVNVNTHDQGATNQWFLNTETNQYSDTTYINTMISLSTPSGWDISLTSQNIPIMGDGAQNYQNDTYAIVSKKFRYSDTVSITMGTQTGYQLYDTNHTGKMHQFYYIDTAYKINPWLKLRGGSYWVNSALSTQTQYTGGMIGATIKYNNLKLTLDYIGGHTNVSGATVNLEYAPNYWINPYIGIGVPEKNSGNEFYGTIGLNINLQKIL